MSSESKDEPFRSGPFTLRRFVKFGQWQLDPDAIDAAESIDRGNVRLVLRSGQEIKLTGADADLFEIWLKRSMEVASSTELTASFQRARARSGH